MNMAGSARGDRGEWTGAGAPPVAALGIIGLSGRPPH